ncbi:cox2 cytochrome oxidase subunit 2 [Rhodanobacter sp. FW510-R12]
MKVKLKALQSSMILAIAGVSSLSLPCLVRAQSSSTGWIVHGYYENETQVRGQDYTGNTVGLSKERNTFQLALDKKLSDHWKFHATLRGTYDGVYRLNDKEYGDKAGGPIVLQNTASPVFAGIPGNPFPNLSQAFVPHGGGINQAEATALGLPPSNAFGINSTNPNAPNYNPNQGMQVLGQRWHSTTRGGVEFGVPVWPCNVDSRGCANFGGYGNLSRHDLELPEFNNRFDFLREIYASGNIPLSPTQSVFVKVGRQQVIWGRTDLFRVLDVINPVDYSRNNIYDELEDARIPMFIATVEYRMGASKWFQESNLQLVWNMEKFRPNNLGQCGTPNAILDAGCFFRGMKNLWDNGGTVSNFAPVPPGTPGMYAATDFGPHQIGIRDVKMPAWTLKNSPIGLKFEGVSAGGTLGFSLNALTYRSQLPSLHSINGAATNAFTGQPGNTGSPIPGIPVRSLIAFDMVFPRINLIGGSLDYQWEWAKSAVRFEGAYTTGEEFSNTLRPNLYSRNPVFRSVLGIDRLTFIPGISGRQATLISAQLFFQHIFDYQRGQSPLGPTGIPDWKNDLTFTLLIKPTYMNGRLSPQLLFAHDWKANAGTISPSVNWLVNNHLSLTAGALLHYNDLSRYNFDDCRSCNPWAPFTTFTGANPPQAFTDGSYGLGGFEPLGRFRAGPLGTAGKENQLFVKLRASF